MPGGLGFPVPLGCCCQGALAAPPSALTPPPLSPLPAGLAYHRSGGLSWEVGGTHMTTLGPSLAFQGMGPLFASSWALSQSQEFTQKWEHWQAPPQGVLGLLLTSGVGGRGWLWGCTGQCQVEGDRESSPDGKQTSERLVVGAQVWGQTGTLHHRSSLSQVPVPEALAQSPGSRRRALWCTDGLRRQPQAQPGC